MAVTPEVDLRLSDAVHSIQSCINTTEKKTGIPLAYIHLYTGAAMSVHGLTWSETLGTAEDLTLTAAAANTIYMRYFRTILPFACSCTPSTVLQRRGNVQTFISSLCI